MLNQFTTMLDYDKYDMNPYSNIPTPPMSGSEGSQSPPQPYINTSSPYMDCPSPYSLNTYVNFEPMINIPVENQVKISVVAPKLVILEQPVEKFRFRYKSEMQGTHGCLNGQNSDKMRKHTYPAVQLLNYNEKAIIRCSLYQCNPNISSDQWQPHAHRLVQKNGANEAVDPHNKEVNKNDGHKASFHNLGIIHTAKKFLVDELMKKKRKLKEEEIIRNERIVRKLKLNEEQQIKSEAQDQAHSMNLNIVCLRFDAFTDIHGYLESICEPVFSHAINNLKSALTGDLKITRMDRCTSPVAGGKEVFLLVEKVTKKNIKVRFFEVDDDDKEVWNKEATFNDGDVHHQYAIVIKTPKYCNENIEVDKKVFIELYRPSDGARSEPLEFTYYPDRSVKNRKRPRYNYNSSSSSFSSSEIPATLNLPELCDLQFNSDDLQQLTNEVNSEDFNNMVLHDPSLKLTFETLPDLGMSISMNDYHVDYAGPHSSSSRHVSTATVNPNHSLIILRTCSELIAIKKTGAKPERILEMLQTCFTDHVTDEQETALHLYYHHKIMTKGVSEILCWIIDFIIMHKKYELLNLQNASGETILHLAIENEFYQKVQSLVNVMNLTLKNEVGNTALHVALKRKRGYKLLLKSVNVETFINLENNDGESALHIAVKTGNLDAVQALYSAKCDINIRDKKTGNNVLHNAIKNENKEMVSYLVENTDIDISATNFCNLTCAFMAKFLDMTEISEIIETHLKGLGVLECEVKMEPSESEDEDEDDEAMEIDEKSPDIIKELYKNMTELTPTCLSALSQILDKNEKWKKLPGLLQIDCVMKIKGLFESCSSPTKVLFNFAVANGTSIYQIRQALEQLMEKECVGHLDEMVMRI